MTEEDIRSAVKAAKNMPCDELNDFNNDDFDPRDFFDDDIGQDDAGDGASAAADRQDDANDGTSASGDDQNTEAPRSRSRLQPIRWHEIPASRERHYLAKGLLDAAALSVGYGDPGCGKTFIALDIGLHVALGRTWFGRKVRQGLVVYIAAEAGLSITDRLTAFAFRHNIKIEGVPFYVIPDAPDLANDDGDVAALLERLRALPEPPALIIVDTLARCMGGRSEDHAEDMGAFVAGCDRLRTETDAHILALHHPGKDKSRGARGSVALRAAADTEFFIERDEETGIVTATVTKQRDMVAGDTFAFKLEVVEIGQDEDEEAVTSCVVVPTESATTKRPQVTGAAKIALDLLVDAIACDGEVPPASNHIPANIRGVRLELWRSYADKGSITGSDKPDTRQKAFKRAFDRLQSLGLIGYWEPWVWLPDKPDITGQT